MTTTQWKRNLITAWVTQVFSLIGFGFVMPFLPYYIQELGVTSPESLRLWVGYISAAPPSSWERWRRSGACSPTDWAGRL